MLDPIWHKIAEAYEMVGKDSSRRITVEMNGMRAVVGYTEPLKTVTITVMEIPTEKPVLIQP